MKPPIGVSESFWSKTEDHWASLKQKLKWDYTVFLALFSHFKTFFFRSTQPTTNDEWNAAGFLMRRQCHSFLYLFATTNLPILSVSYQHCMSCGHPLANTYSALSVSRTHIYNYRAQHLASHVFHEYFRNMLLKIKMRFSSLFKSLWPYYWQLVCLPWMMTTQLFTVPKEIHKTSHSWSHQTGD